MKELILIKFMNPEEEFITPPEEGPEIAPWKIPGSQSFDAFLDQGRERMEKALRGIALNVQEVSYAHGPERVWQALLDKYQGDILAMAADLGRPEYDYLRAPVGRPDNEQKVTIFGPVDPATNRYTSQREENLQTRTAEWAQLPNTRKVIEFAKSLGFKERL